MIGIYRCVLFLSLNLVFGYTADEPQGCSQFHNLEHLLEKLVRLEFKIEQLEKRNNSTGCVGGQDADQDSSLKNEGKTLQIELELEQLKTKFQEFFSNTVPITTLSKVAFSALISDTLSGLGKGQVILFTTVEINIGNAYNPATGLFTAPVNGTYHFQTSFLSEGNDEIWVYIDLNGTRKTNANAKGHNGRHGTGTQSIILNLIHGDLVSVRIGSGSNILGGKYSSFSGFLLY